MTHKLFTLARMYGPTIGNVAAHLNAADIRPLEFDVWTGDHLYADEAHEHLAKLAGEADEVSHAAAESGGGDWVAHVPPEEDVWIDASLPTHKARAAFNLPEDE